MDPIFNPNKKRKTAGTAPRGTPSKPLSEHPSALLSQTLYNQYRVQHEAWATDGQKAKDYAAGRQFTEDQIETLRRRGQAAVPMNAILPAMEQSIALLTANNPSYQALAVEDSDVRTARAVSDLLTDIWYKSGSRYQFKETLYDTFQTGRGVMLAYVDPDGDNGLGGVRHLSIDGLKVFVDPNSRDRLWRDAAHILTRDVLTGERILDLWPKAEPILKAAPQAVDDDFRASAVGANGEVRTEIVDAHHQRFDVLTRYTKTRLRYEHIVERDTGEEKALLPEEFAEYAASPAIHVVVFDESGQPVDERYFVGDMVEAGRELLSQATPNEDGSATLVTGGEPDPATGQPTPQQMLLFTVVTHQELIDEERIVVRTVRKPRILTTITIGGYLYEELYLPIEDYPLVPFMGRFDRDPFPQSDVSFVMPLQDSLNKIHMQLVANLASSTNMKAFIPRGAMDKEEAEKQWTKAGAALMEYDAEMGQPHIAHPSPPPVGLFQHFQLIMSMIERELGIYSVGQGDGASAPPTYKGTLALDEYGQRRIRSKLDDIEGSLEQLGRVTLQYAQQVYTEERILRLQQPNNTVKETVINQFQYDDFGREAARLNDMSMGTYDVRVVAGSTLPSNRYALLEYYLNLYQMGIIDQVEVLKKTDVADAEGVIERTGRIGQLEQALAQAQEEIKRLRGDNQTAHREVVQARKQAEVGNFRRDVQVAQAEMDQAKAIYQARLSDQLKVQKRQAELDRKSNSK